MFDHTRHNFSTSRYKYKYSNRLVQMIALIFLPVNASSIVYLLTLTDTNIDKISVWDFLISNFLNISTINMI